jgi:outer membrane protein OmpA-like peptidoglycan-associated protein
LLGYPSGANYRRISLRQLPENRGKEEELKRTLTDKIDDQHRTISDQEQRGRDQGQEIERLRNEVEALKAALVTALETAGFKTTSTEPSGTVTGSDDKTGSGEIGTPSGKATLTVPIQESLLFPLNSYELTLEGRERTKTLAEILKDKAPGRKISVEGHASQEKDGQEAYNQSLSERRAKNVADTLVTYGVGRGSLETKGFGHSQPLSSNDTEEGRRQNRRVEVKINLRD